MSEDSPEFIEFKGKILGKQEGYARSTYKHGGTEGINLVKKFMDGVGKAMRIYAAIDWHTGELVFIIKESRE